MQREFAQLQRRLVSPRCTADETNCCIPLQQQHCVYSNCHHHFSPPDIDLNDSSSLKVIARIGLLSTKTLHCAIHKVKRALCFLWRANLHFVTFFGITENYSDWRNIQIGRRIFIA